MEQEWAAYSFNYPVVFSYVSEKELSSSNIKKKIYIFLKETYSCVFGNGTLHFSVEVRKIKKYPSKKNSLSFRKRNFLALIFKNLLYFLKRNLFLYFGKWNLALLIPSSKSNKILPEKLFLYFRKWKA